MALDIEKIKAALKVADAVFHDFRDDWRVIAGVESIQYIRATNARNIALEALAALEAYDRGYAATTIRLLSKRVSELEEELEKLHAKLESYDPDAIRRECAEAGYKSVDEARQDCMGWPIITPDEVNAAIMHAGKE